MSARPFVVKEVKPASAGDVMGTSSPGFVAPRGLALRSVSVSVI